MHVARSARRRSLSRIVAMLAACGALAACGYKGSLYLPGSPQDHPRRVPPPALTPGQAAAPAPTATPKARSDDTDDAGVTQPVPDLFKQQ